MLYINNIGDAKDESFSYNLSEELKKSDLLMNKWGRIVSAKKHATAKKEKRLEKHGFFAKKGKFGFVKKNKTRKNNKSIGRITTQLL